LYEITITFQNQAKKGKVTNFSYKWFIPHKLDTYNIMWLSNMSDVTLAD